jgi:hypothetical protein
MAKPRNRHRAEVELPGSGGRFIRFTVDAMERLETKYPDDWLKTVNDGLDTSKPSVIIACIDAALIGEEPFDARYYADEPGLADEVIKAIKDGLFLTFSGKTQAQLIEEQEKKTRERMLKLGIDPKQIEELIFLRDAGMLDTRQASSPTKSEDSPL